ncbi:hypothetical protein ACZ75_01105 [Massilia sp. NR 4-1]|nr:hypothetical protein ACZ75_01105 [Massilia sp. NR 4-1]
MHKAEFSELFVDAKHWNQATQIQEAIGETASWLHVVYDNVVGDDRITEDYYYSYGAVRLAFDAAGTLVMIVLAEGYQGTLFDEIRIGDRLDRVLNHADLHYDDVDELHHASIAEGEIGLSIYAEESPLFNLPDQKISRIFVHDDFL